MRADVIRMVADFLADTDKGVNVILPKVPKDAGDSTPANVTVCDETRHGWVARGDSPPATLTDAGPVLAVFLREPIKFDWNEDTAAQPYHKALGVAVGIAYYASNSDSDEGSLDASITMRAVRSCLVDLNHQNNSADRERNKVRIDCLTAVEEVPTSENKEDKIIAGGITARFDTTDIITTP